MPYEINAGENLVIKIALMAMSDGQTFQGDWSAIPTYVVDDVVVSAQIAYLCTAPHTNHEPPNASYWDVVPSIAASDVKSVQVELISPSVKTPDTWAYEVTAKTPVTWSFSIDGVDRTSGLLTTGDQYYIIDFNAGDDFTNVGGVNTTGTSFTATGDTPTTWTNGSILRPVTIPSNLRLADGLLTLELLSIDSVNLKDLYELKMLIGITDANYVGTGAQTDVMALTDVLNVKAFS